MATSPEQRRTIIAKHTRGPWKVFYASNGSMLGVAVDRPSDEDHASGVTDAHGGLWGMGGEKQANAHLIAAAPELYEAVCRAIKWLAICDDPRADRDLHFAEAVIAKATSTGAA